jgi:hypothetical protein
MSSGTLAEAKAILAVEGSYDSLVEAGQIVLNQTAWILGDLADKVESSYGEAKLEQYASDIGVPFSTLKRYRTVARAFPEKERRLPITFGVAQALASQPDRFELAAQEPTVREARALVNARKREESDPHRLDGSEHKTEDAQVIKEIKRQLRHVNDVVSPDRCEELASALDRAANRARSKAKALRLEIEK